LKSLTNLICRLQVNHLSTALLSFLLVPNMLKAAELHASSSRLVIVASEMHFVTHFDEAMIRSGIVAKLNDKEYCTPEVMSARYPASKRTCFHSCRFYMDLLTFSSSLECPFYACIRTSPIRRPFLLSHHQYCQPWIVRHRS
jgi:hypothetical protein